MSKNNKSTSDLLRIAGVLTLICSVVALMLAAVNMVTKATIDENTKKEKAEAIGRIFGEIDEIIRDEENEREVYLVTKDSSPAGYCVAVTANGYGGDIEMLVGINLDKTVKGIQIVSMSETPGVGSKVKTDSSFLPQFEGKSAPLALGDNVDGISGASISSKGVTEGVNDALSVEFDPVAFFNKVSSQSEQTDETTEDVEATTDTAPETSAEVETETPSAEVEGTHIDPAAVGLGAPSGNYPSDNAYVEERGAGYYLEHETTDTESETLPETDAEGNIITPENGATV